MGEVSSSREFTPEEMGLALRNHGMHLEGLRYPITPVGMHYLLVHFDVPFIEPATYALQVGGRVRDSLTLTLDDLKARASVTSAVMLECAGTGRAHLSPRPVSAPWHDEAVGCAEWTGTPLRSVLEEVGVLDDAVEVVFSAHDRGIDQGVEHDYERSLSIEDAFRDEVLLAYEMNGQPLPPQHGFPLRLIVPGWYGMASVKWLRSITITSEPFDGVQQRLLYRYQRSEDDPGTPVTRQRPHALMRPPGIPDFLDRTRHLRAGRVRLDGRAWSGLGAVARVEFSSDRGATWSEAELGEPVGPYAWTPWSCSWQARPGEHELCVRATDAAGNTQAEAGDGAWNRGGYGVNLVQRVPVVVS